MNTDFCKWSLPYEDQDLRTDKEKQKQTFLKYTPTKISLDASKSIRYLQRK